LRNEHGWSQAQLAEAVELHAAQISRYERSKMTPSADILVRIAEALDVSCDYLLIDDAPRRPFRSADRHLGERFAALEELPPEDLASLLNHLDALIAKNRLKAIAGDVG
jgi:transcriptional regulator with XRE-family HTH domain